MKLGYLTEKNEEIYDFKKLALRWENNDLVITILRETYTEELFSLLQCYRQSTLLDSIFLIWIEHGIVNKERLPLTNILGMSYTDFVIWQTELNSNDSFGSGEWGDRFISGMEIRFRHLGNKALPSFWGCTKIIQSIRKEI